MATHQNMLVRFGALSVVTAVLLGAARQSFAEPAGAPSPDTVKQTLNQRWQQLKPQEVTERNVLFQDVRTGGTAGTGSYLFQVSATIRDYSPGYPRNRYFGQTCVAHMNGNYKLWATSSGVWQVDGRMTPDLSSKQCKANPSDGVSSIPLQTLPGTPAPEGAMAVAPSQPRSIGGVTEGSYECWANGQARTTLNFAVRPGGQYVGSDGKAGRFSVDSGSRRITFHGGMLDGALPSGFFAVYEEPKGRPTVSFRNSSGSEAAFCEKE